MPMTGSRRVAVGRMSKLALAAGQEPIRWSMFAASAGRTVSGIMAAASFYGIPTMLDVYRSDLPRDRDRYPCGARDDGMRGSVDGMVKRNMASLVEPH